MKLVIWKNCFGGQLLYWSVDRPIKNGVQVGFHFRQLMDKMVDEEQNVLQNLLAIIAEHEENIRVLNLELGNAEFEYSGPPEVMQKESALINELKKLETAKEKRMVILFELKTKEQQLCDKLVLTPGEGMFFLTKMCNSGQYFDFWTEMSIFDQNFDFWT